MNTGEKSFSILVIMLGAAAVLAQVLLFREMLALSLGNELSAGLILFFWLVGIAAGSAAGGAYTARRGAGEKAIAASLILLCTALPLCIILARSLRPITGYIQGETVPLGALCWMLPAGIVPVSALAGFSFALMCAASRPGRVYSLDAAGSLAGSLAYTFALVFLMSPMGAAVLSLAAALAVVAYRGPKGFRAACAAGAAACLLCLLTGGAARVEMFSRGIQWRGTGKIAAVQESPYANITAVRQAGQTSLFSNGRLAGSVPERFTAEPAAHVPLSLCKSPRRVLIIGGGAEMIREALKHGPEKVVAVELDPVLMGLRERFASVRDFKTLHDRRVQIMITDTRKYITRSGPAFDAIIVRAGEPETLMLNRYATEEFFRAAAQRLRPGGVFATRINFQENSMNARQADLLGTYIKTMRPAFGAPLLAITRGGAFLIAVRGGTPGNSEAAALAVRNYTERGVRTRNFGQAMLFEALDGAHIDQALQQPEITGRNLGAYFLARDKIAWAFRRLESRPDARVNSDFHPVSTYYQLQASGDYSRSAPAAILRAAQRWLLYGLVTAGIILAFFVARITTLAFDEKRTPAAMFVAAAAGFTGMTIEVSAILAFQSVNGYIYHFIGLIIAAFMAGGALGGWAGGRIPPRSGASALAVCGGGLVLLCIAAEPVFTKTSGGGATAWTLFLVFMAGALTGGVYASACRWSGGNAGSIYAADHIGAAAGALLGGTLLVPIAGFENTMRVCSAAALLIFLITYLICLNGSGSGKPLARDSGG